MSEKCNICHETFDTQEEKERHILSNHPILLYRIPFDKCTCGERLGERYREYWEAVDGGAKSVDVLKKMGYRKMCCRSNLLELPCIPMIDRSKRGSYLEGAGRDGDILYTPDVKPGVEPPKYPFELGSSDSGISGRRKKQKTKVVF